MQKCITTFLIIALHSKSNKGLGKEKGMLDATELNLIQLMLDSNLDSTGLPWSQLDSTSNLEQSLIIADLHYPDNSHRFGK